MQSIIRSFYSQASLLGGASRRVLPRVAAQIPMRTFSTSADLEVKKKEDSAVDLDQKNKRLGVDTVFNE